MIQIVNPRANLANLMHNVVSEEEEQSHFGRRMLILPSPDTPSTSHSSFQLNHRQRNYGLRKRNK